MWAKIEIPGEKPPELPNKELGFHTCASLGTEARHSLVKTRK